MRKMIKIFFIFLMLVISFVIVFPIENVRAAGNTLYVDDTGSGDSITIQGAVNAASPGDTIIVSDGIYYENVNVDKSLTIRSENGTTNCIVNASNQNDHTFEVTANYTNISGFTVENAGVGTSSYIYGIGLLSVQHCNIFDNSLMNNRFGIGLYLSCNNIITGNTASNNIFGIGLYSSCNNNIITGNTANSNNQHGIRLYSSCNNNIITGNTANSNNYFGINLYTSCNNNIITGNTANSNNHFGIRLILSCNNNIITGNTASNNDLGIYLYSSCNNNIITGNTANSNNDYGVNLGSSCNNTITGNTVSNNRHGIRLYISSNNNIITGNTVNSNTQLGIVIGDSDNNIIYNNYFNNTNNANDDGTNTWNINKTLGTNIIGGPYLGGNYWSDYTGIDSDNDGIGDTPYNIPGGSNQDMYPLVEQGIFVVSIDIKPGSYPNSINVKSKGVVPVAILTNDDFDASFVNPNTIMFLGASPIHWAMEDVDNDGDIDMILQFNTQELDFTKVVDEGDEYPYAYLSGKTIYSAPIQGKDAVKLIGKEPGTIINWIIEHFPIIGQLLQRILELI